MEYNRMGYVQSQYTFQFHLIWLALTLIGLLPCVSQSLHVQCTHYRLCVADFDLSSSKRHRCVVRFRFGAVACTHWKFKCW